MLVGALASAIGWYSLKVFRAELRVLDVRAAQQAWARQSTVPDVSEWEQAFAELEEAIALVPQDAEYRRLRGQLQEWRGYTVNHKSVTVEELLTARRLAVAAYREVTRLRPNSAFAWSHLARMKALAGERDEEFKQALRNAMRFGRHLYYINHEVTYIATVGWREISADSALQAEVVDAIFRGLEAPESRAQVRALVNESGLIAVLCAEPARLPAEMQASCTASEGTP